MRFSPKLRKAVLTAHVVTAVGWLGAEVIVLALAAAGLGGADPAVVYPAIGLIGVPVLVPLALTAWAIGVFGSLGTPWGLVRYWWVLAKLASTTVMAALVVFALRPTLVLAADLGAALPVAERQQLVIASTVATTLLVLNTAVSVYKPWGRRSAGRAGPPADRSRKTPERGNGSTVGAGLRAGAGVVALPGQSHNRDVRSNSSGSLCSGITQTR
jgi:hypothetical protein